MTSQSTLQNQVHLHYTVLVLSAWGWQDAEKQSDLLTQPQKNPASCGVFFVTVYLELVRFQQGHGVSSASNDSAASLLGNGCSDSSSSASIDLASSFSPDSANAAARW